MNLDDVANSIDLPEPYPNEHMPSYARRVALIGVLAGAQHTLMHRTPVFIGIPTESMEAVADVIVPSEPIE